MPQRHSRAGTLSRGPITPVHRGPQAGHAPASYPIHAPNAALLIDFDNVTMGIRSDLAAELRNLFSSDLVKGKVSVQRAYADWRRYPQYVLPLTESSIDLIYAPAYGSSKKNATDIRLAIDAVELAITRPEIGTFILLSGDSDFSSLVLKLREYGKYVIGVGIRESSSELLVQNCDEYYSYNSLVGLVNTRDEVVVKWDPWELASEAIKRMKQNGDVMRADRLKQVMQQIDSSFDEKNLGMAKFSRFVSEAAQRGLIALNRMENGQYEVDLPSGQETNGAPIAVPATMTDADLAIDAEPAASEERRPRRSRGRGRGRDRDREGREGRDRGDREGRDRDRRPRAETEVSSELVETPAADLIEPVTPPARRAVAAEPASDGVGASGMRLTRDEAFDLVRRAVASAVAAENNGKPVRAATVRQSARELLGRDSESLSDRNFTRILKDAHDADVIDLRRRGDDFEVAPAVAAAPIADQLSTAEAASPAPARPAAPPAPRGMAPRGVASRGRGFGKTSATPVDLLSIGVVDDTPAAAPVTALPSAAPGATEEAMDAAGEAPRRGRGGRKAAGRKTAAKESAPRQVAAAPQSAAKHGRAAKTAVAKRGGAKTARKR